MDQRSGGAPVAAVARPRGVPLWVVLLVAQPIAGVLLLRPIADAYAGWLGTLLDVTLVRPGSASLLAAALQSWPSNVVMWLGTNMLFLHGLGMPRFGYLPRNHAAAPLAGPGSASAPPDAASAPGEPAPAATSVAARPALPTFMERVRPERRGDLLALRAEGHYLRVYTSNGSDLVLYRMSDATAELDPQDGAQVHRSWWVADRALATERHADRLVLTNGIDVPVSRSYRLAARSRGWLA